MINPSREARQAALLTNFEFKCSCPACSNEIYNVPWQFLPRFDPEFNVHKMIVTGSFKELLKQMKSNFEYLKKNFNKHPSFETAVVMLKNLNLLEEVKMLTDLPFA